MEENLPQTPSGESWNDSIARSLDEQRVRARKFLSGYNNRLADLETDLTHQVEQILQQLGQAKGDRDEGALELAGQTEKLTKLQRLFLPEIGATDAGLEHLSHLTSLRELDLVGTRVTDAGLARLRVLTNLQKLHVGGTQITDAGLEHLAGLTNLQLLGIGNCALVTDQGVAKLQQALPKCKILR